MHKQIAQQKKFLEDKGYNVIYIGLYGSQNYGLDYEKSDIDLRVVVMPTLQQVITREKISKKYQTDLGDIDVKDILTYYEVVRKGNFSFIEPFQTKWFIGDKKLRELFGTIPINRKSVKGAMLEKAKAFRHAYPSKKEEINKWGYDPKQLHHIFRLHELLMSSGDDKAFLDYTGGFGRDYLMKVKLNENNFIDTIPKTTIDITSFETMKHCINVALETQGLIPKDYKYIQVDLNKEITEYIKTHLKLELHNTGITSARQFRTFGQDIPKNDIKRFPELIKYKGKDISYIVYEELEIL